MTYNLPTMLTFSRILLLPIAVLVYYLPFPFAHHVRPLW